jgi:class 3 adenylate cyclase/pimeloyl-ACP methyl ester carboxylesterase
VLQIALSMQKPRVQFARTRDGVSIAYSSTGQGRPVIFLTGFVSHLEIEVTGEPVVQFLDRLGGEGRRRLVRFDWRGTGLSDRDVRDVSSAKRLADLEAVVDALGAGKVVLFAWRMSGPLAIMYAASHPERVSHLILYGSYARSLVPNPALGRALVDLMRADWGIASRTLVHWAAPEADLGMIDLGATFLRQAASGEVAAAFAEESFFGLDVTDRLREVTVPALVLHRRGDPVVSFAGGRELAAGLPDAQFVPLVGDSSNPWIGDPEPILKAVNEFLADEADGVEAPAAAEAGSGLLTILFTDLVGSTELTQRLGDAGAQNLLRTHNTIIRERLREHGGAELKTMGDGFMASFPSGSRALDCAIAIQQAFAAYNDGRKADAIVVRIGLNAGEPVAEEEDLFGTAVQAAARIAARARPGQILVSDVVRQLAAGKPFRFNKVGRVALKGFRERLRLFEVAY